MREDTRTFVFAAVVCVTCSLLLSGAAAGLKDLQDENKAFDVKRNIVKAFGIDISSMTRPEIVASYETHVGESSFDSNGTALPIYTWTDDGADKVSKYAFPVSGKGLWSMLYGYLSLNSDLETVAGISFYKHGETPGLGAEIEKDWFLSQFTGKRIYQDGVATDFVVSKPGYAEGEYAVNGISGATLTGKGVQALIRKDSAEYATYFNSIKGN